MIYLLVFLTLVSLGFPKVFIESNYPLRNNNFQEKVSEENLFLILWALQSLKDVRSIKIMSVGKDTILYVERHPILKKVDIEGNWFVGDEEVKSLILARENEPLINFDPKGAEESLKLFYRKRGFLDAEVKVDLQVDKRGFAYMKVSIKEGEVYFLGSARFEGAKSFNKLRLMLEASLRLGEVYDEEKAKRARFLLQDFYRRKGFLESFVYYEGTRKVRTDRPFAYVLFPGVENAKRRFVEGLGSLFRGVSNLLSHPTGTLKTFFGSGSLAVPIYVINEGERFSIRFEGNKNIKDEELLSLVDIQTPGVDLFFLESTKERIEELYKDRGFFDVKVSYSFSEGRIVFSVEEGKRYELIPLGFKGLKLPRFYDKEVIGELKKSFLERVKEEGYKLARIEVIEEIDRRKKKVFLVVKFVPGKRLILRKLKFVGKDRALTDLFAKYNALLPRVLDEEILDDLHRDIRDYLRGKGYLDGDFWVRVDMSEDEENLYFTYTYGVTKGKRYRYGELLIYGNEKTHPKEIYYTVVKQTYYSEDAQEESLWNLVQSENFTGVRIEELVDKEKKVVHRLVEVREDKRGVLELAVGYNTEEKLRLEGSVKLKNLFGVGIIGRLGASKSQRYETYEAGLSDRFLFSRKYFADTSLFKRLEFHESFDLQSTGYAVSFGYRPRRWISVGVFLSGTENEVTGTGAGNYNLTRYGLFFVRERRDDPVNPRNMTHNSLRLTKVEGDRDYYKVELNNFILREVFKGVSIDGKVALGWAGKGAPIFDRFFLGGLRDMRGYDFEAIGYPEGGRAFVFGRAEILFSVRDPLWAGLYTDAGGVGNSFSGTFGNLKYDIGGAVGIRTPAGFVRLDVAKPLSELGRPMSKVRVYLSIGFVY